MTAYMSIATAAILENQAKQVIVWTSEDGKHSRTKDALGETIIHRLVDFKDGLVVYSDGTQETIAMESK